MEYYVYAYLDPRKPGIYNYGKYKFDYEPFYIGKGKNNRLYNHMQPKKLSKNTHKSNKINKILKSGLKPIVVKIENNISEKKSLKFERDLIENIGIKNLTNVKIGGPEKDGYKHNYESIQKQIDKQNIPVQKLVDGKVIKEYDSIKIATLNEEYGNTYILNCCKGRTKPKDGTDFRYKNIELREKYTDIKKNFKHKKQNKEIYYFDKEYNPLGKFESIREAHRETDLPREYISKCCRGLVRTTKYPYVFSFNETYKEPINIRKCKRKIIKKDLNDNILEEYESITEASKLNNLSRGTISGALNGYGGQKTAGKYKWEYINEIYEKENIS